MNYFFFLLCVAQPWIQRLILILIKFEFWHISSVKADLDDTSFAYDYCVLLACVMTT